MATIRPVEDITRSGSAVFPDEGDEVIIDRGITVESINDTGIEGFVTTISVQVDGTVIGLNAGIRFLAAPEEVYEFQVSIGESGDVDALGSGVSLGGSTPFEGRGTIDFSNAGSVTSADFFGFSAFNFVDLVFVNTGSITSNSDDAGQGIAVNLSGENAILTNAGTLQNFVSSDSTDVSVLAGVATISSTPGFGKDVDGGDLTQLTNSGEILSGGTAFVSIDGVDDISNSGQIVGDIWLEDFDDRLENTGTIEGDVDFGTGAFHLVYGGTITGEIRFVESGTNDILDVRTTFDREIALGGGDDQLINSGRITVTLDLAEGADSVSNSGRLEAGVLTGAGNDSVSNLAGGVVLGTTDLGAGDNQFDNAGRLVGFVNGGDGDDTVINSGETLRAIGLGDGNNTLINSGEMSGGLITMGGGVDTVTIEETGTIGGNFFMGAGDDLFTNEGTTFSFVFAEAGNDSLVNSGTTNRALNMGDGNDTISNSGTMNGVVGFGDGDDALINSAGVVNGTINLGQGDNTVTVTGGRIAGLISGRAGIDTVSNSGRIEGDMVLEGGNDVVTNLAGGVILGRTELGLGDNQFDNAGRVVGFINGSDGDDTVINSGETLRAIGLGDGNNTLINSGDMSGGLITMGGGVDTVTIEATGVIGGNFFMGAGDDLFTNEGTTFSFVFTEEGNDSFVNSGTTNRALNMGDGNDTITNSGTMNGVVGFGDGDDTLINSAGVVNGTINLGQGNDSVSNAAGATISSLINAVSGADSVDNAGTITNEIRLGDGDNSLTNSGTITGNVSADGGNDTLDNSGTITGDVDLGNGNNTVINSSTETLSGTLTTGTGDDTLTNTGVITGNVDLGDGANVVTTTGTIEGDLTLGSGVDQVTVEAGGEITGTLDLGAGGGDLLTNSGTLSGTLTGDDLVISNQSTGSLASIEAATADITNDGTITSITADTLTLINNSTGTIEEVISGSGGDDVRNTGTIAGDISMGDAETRDSVEILALIGINVNDDETLPQEQPGNDDLDIDPETFDFSTFGDINYLENSNAGLITSDIEFGTGVSVFVNSGVFQGDMSGSGGIALVFNNNMMSGNFTFSSDFVLFTKGVVETSVMKFTGALSGIFNAGIFGGTEDATEDPTLMFDGDEAGIFNSGEFSANILFSGIDNVVENAFMDPAPDDLSAPTPATPVFNGSVTGSAGNDEIYNEGYFYADISLGAGNDQIQNGGFLPEPPKSPNTQFNDPPNTHSMSQDTQSPAVTPVMVGNISLGAGRDEIFNEGILDGAGNSIRLGDGEDRVINNGHIVGDIDLGADNDFYDGTFGDATGTIFGREGSDILIGSFIEDQLDGGAKTDILMGRDGDDILTGGEGSDIFIFQGGFGNDTITDFDLSLTDELIDLSDLANVSSFSELIISQDGADTLISIGTDSIRLVGVTATGLSDFNFIFSTTINSITGTAGDDFLEGTFFDDFIDGSDGNDTISDGAGNDVLIGGSGADTFILSPEFVPGIQVFDVIQDFQNDIDTLDLSNFQFPDGQDILSFGRDIDTDSDNIVDSVEFELPINAGGNQFIIIEGILFADLVDDIDLGGV